MVLSGGSKATGRWDTSMSVVKELSCKWIMYGYDHICSSPEIIRNGFQVTANSEATLDCDKDPFDSDSESDDN